MGNQKKNLTEFNGLEDQAHHSMENTTILMEIMRYFGRDVNLLELWEKFKEIHENVEVDPYLD